MGMEDFFFDLFRIGIVFCAFKINSIGLCEQSCMEIQFKHNFNAYKLALFSRTSVGKSNF